MKNKKLKRLSLINLIAGYVMLFLFILLVALNRSTEPAITATSADSLEEVFGAVEDDLFNGVHQEVEREIVYVDRHPVEVLTDHSVGRDRLQGVILDDDPDVVVIRDDIVDNVAVVKNPDHVVIHDRDDNFIINDRDIIGNGVGGIGGPDVIGHNGRGHGTNHHLTDNDDIGVVDVAALNRAVRDAQNDDTLLDRRLRELDGPVDEDEVGIDADEDFGNLTLANDKNDADFDLDMDALETNGKAGKGYGLDKGELYAYNFPSQGIGAGIGNTAVGAGVGAAGLGAGIGQAVLDGQAVPALGGIGASSALPLEGAPAGSPPTDGVGGLACGAGAGGAAGLTTGMVNKKLGLGVGEGKGCDEHGEDCNGHHGHGGRDYNLDHLPKDGALHIMMHVDGRGSILNTRKQLEKMKETLLKDALLPYYNNDEQLYNRRVTIVDGNGERTLQFFNTAAAKDNVLALVFQDEAAPAYHLPNFNKIPQDDYSDDINKLKSNLNGYGGLYRGIMFQVDRGRTYAKSFKEFVECAWQGSGYLDKNNLKKYYWEENKHHIKNKDGIVFSDVYHAKDNGDPQYYLNLIFEAARRVGLDLNIYGAGLVDGKYNNKTN